MNILLLLPLSFSTVVFYAVSAFADKRRLCTRAGYLPLYVYAAGTGVAALCFAAWRGAPALRAMILGDLPPANTDSLVLAALLAKTLLLYAVASVGTSCWVVHWSGLSRFAEPVAAQWMYFTLVALSTVLMIQEAESVLSRREDHDAAPRLWSNVAVYALVAVAVVNKRYALWPVLR